MKGILTVLLALLVSAHACAGRPGGSADGDHADAGHEETASGETATRVVLAPDVVAQTGILTTRAKRASVPDEVQGFGRVLDPLPLIDVLAARSAARSTATLARAEYVRVERLHQGDQNASTRDLDAARAALDRASVDVAGAEARATLAWGGAVDDDAARLADLAAGRVAIVRIDLPAGAHLARMPASATVAPVATPERRLRARLLAPARDADPVLQSEAYLGVLDEGPPAAGTALVASMVRSSAVRTGAAVPLAAVVWVDGRPSVYVEVSPDTFERRDVTVVRLRRGAWLALAGLAPGERVVTRGAVRLLSTQVLKAQPAEED